MKKVAIITYFYKPLNSVATNRINSFVNSLNHNNISCDIYTRYWTGDEKSWQDMTASSKKQESNRIVEESLNRIIYVPYKAHKQYKNKLLSKLYVLKNWLNGVFTFENNLFSSYSFIKKEFDKNNYDFVLASCQPFNLINLTKKLTKGKDIQLIFDFRDLLNKHLLNKNPKFSLTDKIEFLLVKKYLKKTINNSDKIFVISEPYMEFLQELGLKSELLYNGCNFEIKTENDIVINKAKTVISIIGSIYPEQNIQLFINSVKSLDEKILVSLKLNFIGVDIIKSIGNQFRELNQYCETTVTNRIPLNEAIEIGRESDLLLYMGWKGYKGVYSAKIFDYLGFQRPIILCPGDDDVLDDLLIKTNTGKSFNTSEDMAKYLEEMILLKQEKGYIPYEGKYEEIIKYTREYQNQKLVKYILEN